MLDELYNQHGAGRQPPNDEELGKALRKIVEAIPRSYIVLDALDECHERDKLLDFLKVMAAWKLDMLHVLVTGRQLADIDEALDGIGARRVALQSHDVDPDIETYVRTRLRVDTALKWPPSVQDEIEKRLTEGSDGMYVNCPSFDFPPSVTPEGGRRSVSFARSRFTFAY